MCTNKSSAKASGDTVGEVHGTDKPLDPSYKPEHQSKSELPSVTGKSSPMKTVRKSILQTPARPTPRKIATPKSVGIQPNVINEIPDQDLGPTAIRTPAMVQGGARPKTPRMDSTRLAHPSITPPQSHTQPLIPKRILSSTPSGENGDEIDKRSTLIRNIEERRKILEKQNRKIFPPPPIEGIDIGVTEGLETLDPEIRFPQKKILYFPLHWKVC